MFENLKSLRESNNLKQSDVAIILKITQQTYSKYETNEKTIPLNHLNTLSNYYNVSLDYLVGFSHNKSSYDFAKIKTLDKEKILNNIKYVREKNNLSQRTFAKRMRVSNCTISKLEHGEVNLTILVALELCKNFNVSLDWLVGKSKKEFISL